MQNRTTSCDAEIWVVSWKDLLADFIKDKRETGASKIGIDFGFAFSLLYLLVQIIKKI